MIASFIKNARQGSRKIKSLLPIYGLMGTLSLIARNAFWLEVYWQLIREIDLQDEPLQIKIPLTIQRYSTGFDPLRWTDRSKILDIRGDYGLEQFLHRLSRGDSLFCAYSGEEFVGFVWLQLPPVDDVGYCLPDDEAYTFDAWTFEAYRGKRILPALQLAAIQYTRIHHPEICRIVTHIATWNRPSIAGDLRAGYQIRRKEIGFSFLGYHKKWILSNRISEDQSAHR